MQLRYLLSLSAVSVLLAFGLPSTVVGQIVWPEGQILPSFPTPADTQDLIILRRGEVDDEDEFYLFASLKGIVNRTEPRIFAYDQQDDAEGRHTWLNSLGLDYIEHADQWVLMDKYQDEVDGIIVYDPEQIHSVNLATVIASDSNSIIASPRLIDRLTSEPYNFPIKEDLRGRFANKMDVYQTMYDDYWPSRDRRILMGIDPNIIKGAVREYAVALGLATIWLDPELSDESELLNRFLSTMPAGSHYMGWWKDEADGITRASEFGIPTIPSDWSTNLTVHGGFDREIRVKPAPPKPELEDKIYVAFVLSDGDNLQFVEHLMRKIWGHPDRGSVPIGWTISPAMKDAMPGALNYLYDSATDNDNLISGPSGLGYVYPNFYPSDDELTDYIKRTEAYNLATGLRVTTIWNTIVGGIDDNVGKLWSIHAPSTLGLTAQNTGGPLSIYNNSLPGKPLSCNYCWDQGNMTSHIVTASEGWNGEEPRFLLIQSQPWRNATPATFAAVARSLDDRYEVVRPDHLFQLMREHYNLPIDGGLNTISTLPTPLNGATAWQASDLDDQHLRHADSRGRVDGNVMPTEDAYWKMVPGLAGKGVSFKSVNFPDNYLRQRGSEIWADPVEDSEGYAADATFYVRPGLAHDSLTSFESFSLPGSYLRHRGGELFSEPVDDEEGRGSATWIQVGAFVQSSGTTSTPPTLDKNALKLFPNPATDRLSISGAELEDEYILYTVMGRQVGRYTGRQLQSPIPIGHLPDGEYYLKGSRTLQAVKFIKQN